MNVEPITLIGRTVRLEPIEPRHGDGILVAGAFPEIWRWISFSLLSENEIWRFFEDLGCIRVGPTRKGYPRFLNTTHRMRRMITINATGASRFNKVFSIEEPTGLLRAFST